MMHGLANPKFYSPYLKEEPEPVLRGERPATDGTALVLFAVVMIYKDIPGRRPDISACT
jgi:hypothetical protein